MKKILLFSIFLFLISFKHSISAPIKLFGIDVTMNIQTMKNVLENDGFSCDKIGANICNKNNKNKTWISLADKHIFITCGVYNGCEYNIKEVANFFSKELNIDISNLEEVGVWRTLGYCGVGPDGDKICVTLSSDTGRIGPNIEIFKHTLGSSGMTLN
tara:strand:+ start:87 stop:560 length:474 start_codon:yes stop_codon:yes gene_type:complete